MLLILFGILGGVCGVSGGMTPPLNISTLAGMTAVERIALAGFKGQEHVVMTEDGHRLRLLRVQSLSAASHSGRRPEEPILLCHGILSSSDDWILMGSVRAMAYKFAKSGRDVWLSNFRGTLSSSHLTLTQDDDDYWDYSFHQIAINDLPAVMAYVSVQTGYELVTMVGHSRATTQMFVLCSARPDFCARHVRSFTALAPVVYFTDCRMAALNLMSRWESTVGILSDMFGVSKLAFNADVVKQLSEIMCKTPVVEHMCKNILFLLFKADPERMSVDDILEIMAYERAASMKDLRHYAQIKNSGEFRQFDHGAMGNLWHYGSFSPPPYDLSLFNVRTALHWSDKDEFTSPQDVTKLHDSLPGVVSRDFHAGYSHLDFIFSSDEDYFKTVNDRINEMESV